MKKDKVIDNLKKTICTNEILIQTEKDKVDFAKEELRNFKQEIEHWYPGICPMWILPSGVLNPIG